MASIGGQAQGRSNGTETSFDNTQITASKNLTVKSGADTQLLGAQLAADQVTMDVGGSLSIQTQQATSTFASEQSSSGFNMSLCIPPICYGVPVTGSVNQSNQALDHNYISAVGQSGIAAGAGGFDIKVANNTDLKGAAITSSASADKNTLQTASLTSTDLQNQQNTNSSSSSMSLGYQGANTFATLAQNAVINGLANLGGGAGMPENGSQSGTTQSVISPARINITGTGDAKTDANSATQVALLTSRDAATANGALANTLSLQQAQALQGKQQEIQENLQAGQLVGSVAFNAVGDLAAKNDWKDGSPQKIALHAIAGFIQASAAGQSGATGALAGAANEALTQTINAAIDKALPVPQVKDPGNPTNDEKAQLRDNAQNRKALAESAAQLIGMGAVALSGGSAQDVRLGASVALTADRFNRQLHPNEAKWIADNAKRFAARYPGMTEAEAEKRLAQQAFRQVQYGAAGTADAEAMQFLRQAQALLPVDPSCPSCGPGTMFYANPEQKANATMYASTMAQTENFYQRNGLTQPSLQQIVNGANVAGQQLGDARKLTYLAPVAAAGIIATPTLATLAGAAKVSIATCQANLVLCANQAGVVLSDIVAGDAVGGATLAVGTAATVKGLSKLEQEIAALKKAETGAATAIAKVDSPVGAKGGVTAVDAAVATGSPITTRFVNGVTVVDQRTGAVFNGTVDLQPTFDRIASGATGLSRNDGTVFRNLPDRTTGQILLPAKPAGYYTEYVVPTPGINGAGPQRIVTGQSGEMFYTPDHYLTFIPVKKP